MGVFDDWDRSAGARAGFPVDRAWLSIGRLVLTIDQVRRRKRVITVWCS